MATTTSRTAALKAALAEKLPSHAAAPRLAAPNADLSSDVLGHMVELKADEFGIVRPADGDAVRLADALGLAVLRSASQAGPPELPADDGTDEAAADPVAEKEG